MGILDDLSAITGKRAGILDQLGNNEPVDPAYLQGIDNETLTTQGEFVKSLRRFGYSMTGSLQGFAGAMLEPFAPETGRNLLQGGMNTLRSMPQELNAKVPDFGQVHDVPTGLDWAAGKAGDIIGSGATLAAASLLGGGVGALMGRARLGSAIGGVAGMTPLEGGGAALEMQQDPTIMANTTPWERAGTTLGVGVGSSILENIVPQTLFAPRALRMAARTQPGIANAAANVGEVALKGAMGEAATEGTQDLFQQAALRNLNPAREYDPMQVREAALTGALGGGVGGAMAGGLQSIGDNIAPPVEAVGRQIKKVTDKIPSLNDAVGQLRLMVEDPEAFGAQAGGLSKEAYEKLIEAAAMAKEYAGEGLEVAGKAAGKARDFASRQVLKNLDPQNKEWLARRISGSTTDFGLIYDDLVAAFKAKSWDESKQDIGIAGKNIADAAADIGPKMADWGASVLSGVTKGFTGGKTKKSLDIGGYNAKQREQLRNDLMSVDPKAGRKVDKLPFTARRRVTDALMSAADNASFFEEMDTTTGTRKKRTEPIRQEDLATWKYHMGSDLTDVLDALRSRRPEPYRQIKGSGKLTQNTPTQPMRQLDARSKAVAKAKGYFENRRKAGETKEEIQEYTPEQEDVDDLTSGMELTEGEEARGVTYDSEGAPMQLENETSPFTVQRMKEAMASDEKQHANVKGTRLPVKMTASASIGGKEVNIAAKRFAKLFGKDVDSKAKEFHLELSPMSLVNMAETQTGPDGTTNTGNAAAFKRIVREFEAGQGTPARKRERYVALITALEEQGVDVPASEIFTPAEIKQHEINPKHTVKIRVNVDEGAFDKGLMVGREGKEPIFLTGDAVQPKKSKRKEWKEKLDFLNSLDKNKPLQSQLYTDQADTSTRANKLRELNKKAFSGARRLLKFTDAHVAAMKTDKALAAKFNAAKEKILQQYKKRLADDLDYVERRTETDVLADEAKMLGDEKFVRFPLDYETAQERATKRKLDRRMFAIAIGKYRNSEGAKEGIPEDMEERKAAELVEYTKSIPDKAAAAHSKREIDTLKDAYENNYITERQLQAVINYYSGDAKRDPEGKVKTDVDIAADVYRALKLKPTTRNRDEHAAAIQEMKHAADSREESSTATADAKGETTVDADTEEFEAYKNTEMARANLEKPKAKGNAPVPPFEEFQNGLDRLEWAIKEDKPYTFKIPYGKRNDPAFTTDLSWATAKEAQAAMDAKIEADMAYQREINKQAEKRGVKTETIYDIRERKWGSKPEVFDLRPTINGVRVDTPAEFAKFKKELDTQVERLTKEQVNSVLSMKWNPPNTNSLDSQKLDDRITWNMRARHAAEFLREAAQELKEAGAKKAAKQKPAQVAEPAFVGPKEPLVGPLEKQVPTPQEEIRSKKQEASWSESDAKFQRDQKSVVRARREAARLEAQKPAPLEQPRAEPPTERRPGQLRLPKPLEQPYVPKGIMEKNRAKSVVKQSKDTGKKKKGPTGPTIYKKDSAGTIIAKSGGIRPDELLKDGVDPSVLNEWNQKHGNKAVNKKGKGLSLDGIAELLAEHGFDMYDENGLIDATKARELLELELNDGPQHTVEQQDKMAGAETDEFDIDKTKEAIGGDNEFWKNRPKGMGKRTADAALRKFTNGEKLTPPQQKFVDYAAGYFTKDKVEARAEAKVERDAIQAEADVASRKQWREDFRATVKKILGDRVDIEFEKELQEGAAAEFEPYDELTQIKSRESTLTNIRKERRYYVQELKQKDKKKRTTQYTDDEIKAKIAELNAQEEKVAADKTTLGIIRVAAGMEQRSGLAEHEAFHGAFTFFLNKNPEDRRVVTLAFTQGLAAKRLRDHFKDQPEVLKAINDDPEEAAAYGFQLWMSNPNILKVGPKVESLFQRFAKWLRKTFKVPTVEQKAELVFRSLKNGTYAEKGTSPIAKVLDKERPWAERAANHAKNLGGLLIKGYDVFATGTYDRLLKMQNPQLTKIAKLGYEATGEEGNTGGMEQRRRHEFRRFFNQLGRAVEGLSEGQQEKLHDAMIFDRPSGSKKVDEAREKLNKWYADAFKYQEAAGVELSNAGMKENYYPLTFDPEKVLKKKKKFLEMAEQEKYAKDWIKTGKTPLEVWEGITSYIDRGEDFVNVMGDANEPIAESARKRTLSFLSKEDRREFMADDPIHTAVRYIKQATRQAEFVRAFGPNGKKLKEMMDDARDTYKATPDQIGLTQDFIDGLLGNKEVGMPRELKDLYGGLNVYQNYRLLPFNLFSSLVDPVGVGIRSNSVGAAWDTFTYSMKNLFRDWQKKYTPDQWEMLATDMGIIEASGTTIATHSMYDGITMRGTTKELNDKLFKYNLLNGWIRSNTIMATKASQLFFKRSAEGKFGKEGSARYLEELGLTKKDIIWDDEKGQMKIRARDLIDHGMDPQEAIALSKKLMNATEKFVRQSLLQPSTAELPNWMSNPYLMPLAHLKQFTWAFNATIINRITHELQYGNYKPIMLAASYVPGMIAADWMRDMLSNLGDEPAHKRNWGPTDYLHNGVQRSGLTGTGQYVSAIGDDLTRGGSGVEGISGPTIQQMTRGYKAFTSTDPNSIWDWVVKSGPLSPTYDQFLLSGGV